MTAAPSACAVLTARLERAAASSQRRVLPRPSLGLIDFCSNDYLGLAREMVATSRDTPGSSGSTGSRLLSGNSAAAEVLEDEVATFHRAEAALLFNSGYDANLGLFSSLPRDGCQIFYDDRVHASMKDGIALSRAWSQPFRHNDTAHLERRLKRSGPATFVAVESVYSMDGDEASLAAIVDLCERYQASLVVDEAHAGGVYGDYGEGLVGALGLEQRVFARVITYGKAYGCHGASVVGPRLLRDYLVNFAHSFIYTTALPASSVMAIRSAYRASHDGTSRRLLHARIAAFRGEVLRRGLGAAFLPSTSAIQGILLPLSRLMDAAGHLQTAGYDVKGVRSPTVRRGQERLRICLHAYNTDAEMSGLLDHVEAFL